MGNKGDAKRQRILDLAKEMLLKSGPDAFVLRDVAERLGITHGNLQYYFRTRQDLLMAIFDLEVAKYTDSMREAVAATTTRRGRLGAIIDSGFGCAARTGDGAVADDDVDGGPQPGDGGDPQEGKRPL